MNELTIFQFREKREFRTLERDGEPWFVAKDVCDILGFMNVTEALRNLDDDEILNLSSTEVQDGRSGTWGGASSFNIINEPGLYRLIFQSRKPEAKEFKRWVFHEVLPSIRKTGSYSMLKKKHGELQNVYHQMENYRMKYINLLDKLEKEGMTVEKIWKLNKVDHGFLIEYDQKMISDPKAFF
jgi:prophage antirepressor-like protein